MTDPTPNPSRKLNDLDPQPLSVLLVEDDDVAAEAVERSLRKHEVDCPVIWAEDGQVALDILQGRHPTKRIESPFMILLDLNMPRMNGFEFLQALRADKRLRTCVVFVLTTSDSDSDRTRAYHENIAGFMVKASVGPQFARLAPLILEYRNSVTLP
jgi:CheY-like chemotaxis protein